MAPAGAISRRGFWSVVMEGFLASHKGRESLTLPVAALERLRHSAKPYLVGIVGQPALVTRELDPADPARETIQ